VAPVAPCTPSGGRFFSEVAEEIVCSLCPSCSPAWKNLFTLLLFVVVGGIVMTAVYFYNRATLTIVLIPSEDKDQE
jgi:hypothetical protein